MPLFPGSIGLLRDDHVRIVDAASTSKNDVRVQEGCPLHPFLIAELLLLLTVANGTPVIAKKLLGRRISQPLDCGVDFIDGRPLFGPSKTIRGVVLSIVMTAAGAVVLGLGWNIGAAVGSAAVAGDLFSSFVKRRLKLAPSSKATGLDQIPEALLPLLAVSSALALTAADIAITVATFFVGEVLLSRLLYWLRLRDRPY